VRYTRLGVAALAAAGIAHAAPSEPPFYAAALLGAPHPWMGVVSSDGRRYGFDNNSFLDSGRAAFAPRGAAVVYRLCCLRHRAELRIAVLGGRNRIVSIPEPTSPPEFAPDGRVVYATGTTIRYVDGPAVPVRGLPRGAKIVFVAASPRPRRFAVTVSWGDGRENTLVEALYVLSPTEVRRVPIGFDAYSELPQPVWSPDGTRLAFVRAGTSIGGDIYVADANATHLRRLTHSSRGAVDPVWSPNGRELAFTQRYGYAPHHSNGVPEVYVTTLAGVQRRVTSTAPLPPPQGGVGDYVPPGSHVGAWSPDGRWLAVVTNGALGIVPAAGGSERIVERFRAPVDLIGLGPVAWPAAR
jgi:Tol biopolymer transport system component